MSIVGVGEGRGHEALVDGEGVPVGGGHAAAEPFGQAVVAGAAEVAVGGWAWCAAWAGGGVGAVGVVLAAGAAAANAGHWRLWHRSHWVSLCMA